MDHGCRCPGVECKRTGGGARGKLDISAPDGLPPPRPSQVCVLACIDAESRSDSQVSQVCDYIRAHLAGNLGVAELAARVNLSPHYFSMLFRQAVGLPPHRYLLQVRIHEAQRQLLAGCADIPGLALSLGFSDQSHFSRAFRKLTGTTPGRYQRARYL